MDKSYFSPQRSRATTKPKVVCEEVVFCYCDQCKRVIQNIEPQINIQISCCNKPMEIMEPKDIEEVESSLWMDYKILGGYNENVIEVIWKNNDENAKVKWIYLKTFTGGQMKYITDIKKKSFIFALADEDAYVYCDESPCLECTFRCKRGFEIYTYVQSIGLVRILVDRMHPNWQSS